MKTILLMALTADGRSGRSSHDYPDWSGHDDKKLFWKITMKAGVIIMGSKTHDTIDRVLPGRKNIVLTRNKDRVSQQDDLVFTDKHPRDLLNSLKKEGFSEVVLIGGSTINTLFARENLIDEICITYCPIIFGKGLSLFSEKMPMDLELVHLERLGKDRIFVKYRVIK